MRGVDEMGESLHREAYKKLRMATSVLKHDLRKKIESYGITWQQFHALYHISNEGIPFKELAMELQCNASNMTGIIDRMSENGWVYREHSTADRRVWHVKLTQEGEQLKNTLLPKHQENIISIMRVLDEEELQVLKGLLEKLMDGKKMEE